MKTLPILMLLTATAAGAVENDVSQPLYWAQRGVTAHVAGAEAPRNGEDADILVFDSFTNANVYTATSSTPRTFMGLPVELGSAGGSDPVIGKIVVYLAYRGTEAQVFNLLRVRVTVWEDWSGTDEASVFSDAAGSVVADVAGPVVLNPNMNAQITVPLGSPIPLSGLTGHGIAINFQGDTGSGLQSADTLTPLLRYGNAAMAVGQKLLAANYGYRNVTGRTDFNFASTDARTLQEMNEAVAVQLYATGGTLISQRITNFVATPAHPGAGVGSFTVSATGGGSGNPVVFSIATASETVCAAGGTNGATISILAAGICTVRANQAGNVTYGAAPQRSDDVEIGGNEVIFANGFE